MDLQKTDRLYGEASSPLFARREPMVRDDAGRSEAFRNFLKDAELRRADERQGESRAASRRADAATTGRERGRDERIDSRDDNRGESRAASKSKSTDATRGTQQAAATNVRPAEAVTADVKVIGTQNLPPQGAAVSAVEPAAKTAPQAVAASPVPAADTDQPELPETVPTPVAVAPAPVATEDAAAKDAMADAGAVETVPATAPNAVPSAVPGTVQARPAADDTADRKKGAANAGQTPAGKAQAAAGTAAQPVVSEAGAGAVSGEGAAKTDQTTAQNAAVPVVAGEAKAQPVEAPSGDARAAGTPPVQTQPAEQGMPVQAQNGAATAALNTAATAVSAMAGGTQEPGLESLAADAGRGARSAGEPAAPAASGQGAGGAVPGAAASSGGAQANAGGQGNGQGNGQASGQNAAAQPPQQVAGSERPGMAGATTQDSFTTLLARAQGETLSTDPMTAGTPRPGEGAVAIPGTSATPGTQAAAAAAQAAAPSVPRPPMPVSNQVAIQLHNAAKDDVRRVTIHLRPEAMGKVEVSMEVDQAGRLQAVISAEKAEALDWLRRDAHHLERALQDAGMKMDQQSLSFNLRGDGQSGEGSDGKGSGGRGGASGQGDEVAEVPADGIMRRLDALVDVSV